MSQTRLLPLLLLATAACQPAATTPRPQPPTPVEPSPVEPSPVDAKPEPPAPPAKELARTLRSRHHAVDALKGAVKDARARFDELAAAHPAYVYTSSDGSFSGYSWTYRLEVEGEVVTARAYESRDHEGKPADRWTETDAAIGSHAGGPTTGAAALYDACLTTVLTKSPDDHELIVAIGDEGLLELCVYVPKGCMDDCSTGPRISSIEWR